MTAEIIELGRATPNRTPIAHIVHSGDTAFRKLESLYAKERITAQTILVDGSKASRQEEFIGLATESNVDVILDTKCAELSEVGKFAGRNKEAPWAKLNDDKAPVRLAESEFILGSNFDLFGQIARFAVTSGVTSVLAPTHYLRQGAQDKWWLIDLSSVGQLRSALDREGGANIRIDYPLIIKNVVLQNPKMRQRIIRELSPLPFDNLYVRASGLGKNAGPITIKRTFSALEDLKKLGKPVVLDHIGGLVGNAAIAFGVVSGLGRGIGERERFDASGWHTPPKERKPDEQGGGAGVRFKPPNSDLSFTKAELGKIISKPRGRRLLSCSNRKCCLNGYNSMQKDIRAHFAFQNSAGPAELSKVPDKNRVQHFLDTNLNTANRQARDLAMFDSGDEKLNNRLKKGRERSDLVSKTLETMASSFETSPFVPLIRRPTPTLTPRSKNNE